MLLLFFWGLLLVEGFTTFPGAFVLLKITSATVFLALLWPWIRGPYLLYTRSWRSLHAGFELRRLSPEEAGVADNVASSLNKLGFEFAGILTKDVGSHRPIVQVAMYVHTENRDSAQIGRVTSRSRTVDVLVFKTRFDDGFSFETSNSHAAPIFRVNPQFLMYRFPQLRSRPDLYRIHQKLKERFANTRHAVIAGKTEELTEFMVQAEKTYQSHMARDYRLNVTGDRYVYKIRGAIRRAWLHTWPVNLIRHMRVEHTAMKTAEEFGLRINQKLGRLEDSRIRQRMQL